MLNALNDDALSTCLGFFPPCSVGLNILSIWSYVILWPNHVSELLEIAAHSMSSMWCMVSAWSGVQRNSMLLLSYEYVISHVCIMGSSDLANRSLGFMFSGQERVTSVGLKSISLTTFFDIYFIRINYCEYLDRTFFFYDQSINMQSVGELVGAGLVAFMFLKLANPGVKNSGILDEGNKEPMGVATEPLKFEEDKLYADAGDVQSRSPEDVCQVKPPEMISTSLLPSENDAMDDSDFMTISPEKLQNINFLNAGWSLGRDTTTNTMRNASLDLRSELPNPKILNLENNSFANTTIGFMPKRSFEPELPKGELEFNDPN